MSTRGTPMIGIRLDPKIRSSLEEICKEQNISISDAVRLAILDFLEKNKTDAP